MKKCVWLLIMSSLLTVSDSLHGQGSLSPSGPPAPTMITLSQIEPRTPISSGAVIAASGSYYLTTNLMMTNIGTAITINASGVTLDLKGFTISSTAVNGPTFLAIRLSPLGITDITILNGHITGGVTNSAGVFSGPGFAGGIGYSGSPNIAPSNIRVANVSVSGCLGNGIYLGTGSSSVVESCVVQTVGGAGITAGGVFRSSASLCGGNGIVANNASDCSGYSIGASGMYVNQTADNCYGYGSIGDGLDAGTANNCRGYSGSNGIGMNVSQTANNCYAYSTNGNGLEAGTAHNCYGGSGGPYPSAGLVVSTANNCSGFCAAGIGISCSGGTLTSCTADNCSAGFSCSGDGTTVTACTANYDDGGILVSADYCKIIGNTCSGIVYTGVSISGGGNRIEDNHITSIDSGIWVQQGVGNIIIKNSVAGAGANDYSVPSGNIVGPIISSTGTITNANPWANFAY